MNTQYERYYTPREPKDPDAEYLDAAETAYVFKTGVRTIFRLAKELNVGATIGRKKMFSREHRRAIYDRCSAGGAPTRIPTQRRRMPRSQVKPVKAAA
ncbi:hypothetical protein [Streptomyces sp. NPDC020983]|uniref:hypothetical protein n=1 Tax=Streptomyces sp. NPDC020983 TaxID=3365106 RepID=UPI00379CD561